MNTSIRTALATLALSILITQLSTSLHAQGSLQPPSGVPAPSMKTLDQVEARTPLVPGAAGVTFNADGGMNITQPGSYYLTRPFDYAGTGNAINVLADQITLDLNGFTVRSTAASAAVAIDATGRKDISIANGIIQGGTTESSGVFTPGGFSRGINATGSNATGFRVRDITVRGVAPGGSTAAIHLPRASGKASFTERCVVEISTGLGIRAGTVINCTATRCYDGGINANTVSDSEGHSLGGSSGISADTVTNSTGTSVSGYGLLASWNVHNSLGSSASGIGLYAGANASNCGGVSSSGTGLSTLNATNCTGTSTSGSEGLKVTGTASFCRGSRLNGTAINAGIAIGCTASSGSIASTQKHLGTP